MNESFAMSTAVAVSSRSLPQTIDPSKITAATTALNAAASTPSNALPNGLTTVKSHYFHLIDLASFQFDRERIHPKTATVESSGLLKALVLLVQATEAGKDLTPEKIIGKLAHMFAFMGKPVQKTHPFQELVGQEATAPAFCRFARAPRVH